MQDDFFFVAESKRGRVIGFLFRQQQHASRARQFDRGPQTRNSGANHNEISLGWQTFHKRANGTTSRGCAIKPALPIGYYGIPWSWSPSMSRRVPTRRELKMAFWHGP